MSRHFFLSLLLSLSLCATALADLHDPNNRADYLIVTTSELIQDNPWIAQLADWRDQHGRVSMVVPTEDVWAEFGDGSSSDTVLKEFFHYARQHWAAPQLRDVFIIGFHDVVPSHVQPDSLDHLPFEYLSDFFFTTDPESTNAIPVLSIGRLPWSPAQSPSLWDYFAKVVAYETADTAAWQTRIHLIADYSDAFFNFWEDFCEPLANVVPEGYTIERDYPDFEEGHPWHGDREEIIENLQSGSFLVAYMGHGNGGVWSERLALEPSDFVSLTNGNRLPIITTTAMQEVSDSGLGGVPATLIANPDGGAIAYFGNISVVWAYSGLVFRLTLFEHATSDSVETLGEIWRETEEEYIRQNGVSGENFRHTAFGCMLLGDPGLRLPERVSAAHENTPTIPTDMCLEGNYPNPFNPTTKITFRLSHAAKISLKIYDILGREVTTLADGFSEAGTHSISWDATGMPSGLYFCRMEASGFAHTKKLLLLK